MEARGVRKTYEAEGAPVRALRGIDVTMDDTEFVAVMGPSGCGKSTLLNLVAGLDTPTKARSSWRGVAHRPTRTKLSRMRRQHIGIVFQFFNLLEGMSVLENVTLPAVIAGARRRARPRAGPATCSTCSASPTSQGRARVLSGGQRQRLAIARALANKPTLLLADEPTARSTPTAASRCSSCSAAAHRGPGHPARHPRRRRRRGRPSIVLHARRPDGRRPDRKAAGALHEAG